MSGLRTLKNDQVYRFLGGKGPIRKLDVVRWRIMLRETESRDIDLFQSPLRKSSPRAYFTNITMFQNVRCHKDKLASFHKEFQSPSRVSKFMIAYDFTKNTYASAQRQ